MLRLLRAIPVLFLMLLAACGAATTITPAAPALDRSDPAAVNAAWVEALRANDRAAALALYDVGSEDANAINVGNDLEALVSASDGGAMAATPRSVRDYGAAKRAYSEWIIKGKPRCFSADLNQMDGQWTVTGWFAESADDCAQ